jgi:hypothetical protein
MVSYIIQTAIIIIFGPILSLLCIIYNVDLTNSSAPEPQERHSRILNIAGNLSRSAQTANILTSLSVLTASLIRIQQLPPVAELTFIWILGSYQWLVAVGTSASYWAVFGGKSIRFSLLRFYAIVIFGIYMGVLFLNNSTLEAESLNQITWHCVFDWEFPSPDSKFKGEIHEIEALLWPRYWLGIPMIYLALFFSILYFSEQLLRVYNVLQDIFVAICKRLHVSPRRLLFSLCVTTITTIWALGSVRSLLSLESQRQQLQHVSSDAYQDSQWGFGQVTTVLLWGPMCSDIVLEALG